MLMLVFMLMLLNIINYEADSDTGADADSDAGDSDRCDGGDVKRFQLSMQVKIFRSLKSLAKPYVQSSEKTSLPEFFCSASLCEASKKITGNGFFSTFVTQLDSKFWPGFASQKSRSSFCFTSFDFRFLSKFLISFA